MNEYLIPPINSKGMFTVDEKISDIIRDDIEYKVTAIRNIKDIILDEVDVKTLIYTKLKLTDEDYEHDLEHNVPIITLQNPSGDIFNIPASLIRSIPNYTGVKYVERTLAVNLGQLPENLDVDFITDEVKDLIATKIGVKTEPVIFDSSQTIVFTYKEHETYESLRKANITNPETCESKLQLLSTKFEEYKKRMKLLVNRLTKLENKDN